MKNNKHRKIADRLVPLGGVLVGGGWIPQLILLWQTRNISGLSLGFLTAVSLGVGIFVYDAWVTSKETGNKSLLKGQLINFLPGFVTLLSYLIIRFIF